MVFDRIPDAMHFAKRPDLFLILDVCAAGLELSHGDGVEHAHANELSQTGHTRTELLEADIFRHMYVTSFATDVDYLWTQQPS